MATISGKWKFNDSVSRGDDSVDFSANFSLSIYPNETFVRFYWGNATNKVYLYQSDGSHIFIYGSSLPNQTIDFGENEQTISNSEVKWLTENAKMLTKIIYNDLTNFFEIDEGRTSVLACKGKKAVTDIVWQFVRHSWVTYNGQKTPIEQYRNATFNCANKKMISDIVISDITHYLFNGVRLPMLPIDLLFDYPFAFLYLTSTSTYLYLSAVIPYWYPTADYPTCMKADGAGKRLKLSENGDVWEVNNTLDNMYYIVSNGVMWSNYDIPNGSADATDIYLYGSEPVPTE